jgi:hypothetical protein
LYNRFELEEDLVSLFSIGFVLSNSTDFDARSVHDGTWKECSGGHEVGDFVSQIKTEYERLNRPSKSYDVDLDKEVNSGEEDGWLFV